MNELHENSYDDDVNKQSGKQTKKRKLQDDDYDDDEEKQKNSHDSDNDDDDDSSATHKKKGRVSWSPELHHRFILAVNQLGIDKAVPRKILDLMKVENLTRENVASHLQKYRLHLKKVAASGNANPSTLRMGSLSGVASFQTLSGSENFDQNYAFGSLPTSLNNPASQNVYGLPSSRTHEFGRAQNFNSFNNTDQLKLKSTIASCSCRSQESAEIAELRKEFAATGYELFKLKEMMVQQDRLIQSILQFVCQMHSHSQP